MAAASKTSIVGEWLSRSREDSYVNVEEMNPKSETIFRVPEMLKELNEASYIPRVISFGPYHFLKPHLVELESEKAQIIARSIMSSLSSDFFKPLQKIRNEGSRAEDMLLLDNFFSKVMSGCRDMYEDKCVQFDNEMMCLMMFRDASFLIKFLQTYLKWTQDKRRRRETYQFCDLKLGEGLFIDIIKDVIKLENQISLFVVEALYLHIGDPKHGFDSFIADKCFYYSPFWANAKEHLKNSNFPSGLGRKSHLLASIHEMAVCQSDGASESVRLVERCRNWGYSYFSWIRKDVPGFKSKNFGGSKVRVTMAI